MTNESKIRFFIIFFRSETSVKFTEPVINIFHLSMWVICQWGRSHSCYWTFTNYTALEISTFAESLQSKHLIMTSFSSSVFCSQFGLKKKKIKSYRLKLTVPQNQSRRRRLFIPKYSDLSISSPSKSLPAGREPFLSSIRPPKLKTILLKVSLWDLRLKSR